MTPTFASDRDGDVEDLREDVRQLAQQLGPSAGSVKLRAADGGQRFEIATTETRIAHGQKKAPSWRPYDADGVVEQTKAADDRFVYVRGVGALRAYVVAAGNGAGARTMTGAKAGDRVVSVVNLTDQTDDAADAEATITVDDQIQQLATNHTGDKWLVMVSGKVTAGIEVF